MINLRPQQLIRVIDIHRLPCRKEVDGSIAFAMPIPCVFDAAEGQMHFRADGGGVDVGDAGFKVSDCGEGAIYVLCVEGCREPVFNGVGNLDGLLEGLKFNQAYYRAEDFFTSDAHVGSDSAEYGRLKVSAVRIFAIRQHAAACE